MAELFGRANGGLGLSFTRLTVGASDFSRTHYSYDDTPGNAPDPELQHFSIEPARQYVLPRVREALAINPELKVMISPWSAPAWMKTTRSLIQGQLVPQYYPAFANYLARTVEEFGAEGVPVSMLTIQNEPDFEPDSYPGMRVNSPDRAKIIGGFVGPTFRARGLKTQILDYDHNWDNPEMPWTVLSDPVARRYVAGVAWHCYEGDVPAQTPGPRRLPRQGRLVHRMLGRRMAAQVRRHPRLDDRQADHRRRPTIGRAACCCGTSRSIRRTARTTAGAATAAASITIDPATGAITRNVEYYVLGHASRFVLPGAWRVAAAKRDGVGRSRRVRQPRRQPGRHPPSHFGRRAVTIALDGQRYSVPLAQGSVATLRWAR